MGAKKILYNQILTAGAMTGSTTLTSSILTIANSDNIGLELTWSGTPVGTISVLVSNSGITFYALTFNPILSQPAGSAGGYVINLNQVPFQFLEVQYTNTSSTGVLNVYAFTKDVN